MAHKRCETRRLWAIITTHFISNQPQVSPVSAMPTCATETHR